MQIQNEIVSLTPAVPGWWAMFTDEKRYRWYSPVAAWALCQHVSCGVNIRTILPVLTGEEGVTPVDQNCELLYLPEKKFIKVKGTGKFIWRVAHK